MHCFDSINNISIAYALHMFENVMNNYQKSYIKILNRYQTM